MNFSTDKADKAAENIYQQFAKAIGSGKNTLWLISGGSAINLQVAIMRRLHQTLPDKLSLLTILPVDERFGPVGHENSNTSQMKASGFEPADAQWYDVLAENLPMSETVALYAGLAEDAFASAEVVIATLLMGADGHTAGILPGSPAITDTTSTAVGYEWSDFTRLTLGVTMLLKIDQAYILAYGDSKKKALNRLKDNSEPIEALPAKLLYDIAEVTVYNDYINT
ncbi:6-phosphogluconolactonase [Candidatus Saccharibacteria bacterium]|nr:MAG: 6-phosphogluconolactonase [Candidatus Saccharibacteria bacterium]